MNNNLNFDFLTEKQIFGNNRLDIIKKCGIGCKATDFSVLMGLDCNVQNNDIYGSWWTKTRIIDNYTSSSQVFCINYDGNRQYCRSRYSGMGVRPVLNYNCISSVAYNKGKNKYGIEEVEYGEYPQEIVDKYISQELEKEYNKDISYLKLTGKKYTIDDDPLSPYFHHFKPKSYMEYEYGDNKYIRFDNISYCPISIKDKIFFDDMRYCWISVKPIVWLVSEENNIAISKKILFSGINFRDDDNYDGKFSKTFIKKFMDNYFSKEIVSNKVYGRTTSIRQTNSFEEERKQVEKRRNPYGLKFGQVSEEEIIRGGVESGVAVFLHGPSSEGKSARVKQIDPTCEIIYLRNATPESINGKSVYNAQNGEMIDVKPSWLKKVEEKCEKEPNRFHVVFFDEITNALPSIQGIAFNIVLDREVNGKWKLPENARIVAAGNDMKDSLAANKLAEPLFNRFAHVYIKTTTESWLKWASENNIHPAIYSYIAYTRGKTLRSEYDGEKPNADPRKWEMASKMLYATGRPEMLRALVGEDITREFVEFCNEEVITLEDVINENYSQRDIQALNTAQRYATTMGLSQVEDTNLEKVREFVSNLGREFVAIFDSLWTHGDENRLETLAEAKLADYGKKGKRI